MAGDVGDDEVAVVDRVLDRDDVLLAGDLREVDAHAARAAGRLEVLLEVERDVVLGTAVSAAAEDLTHDSHVATNQCCRISSCAGRTGLPADRTLPLSAHLPRMPSRRALLASLGSGAAAATTGCIDTVRSRLGSEPPIDGPCARAPESWSTAGGDAARTARTETAPPPENAESSPLRLGTDEESGRRLASSAPVIGNETAFTPVAGGVVAADPGDEPRWVADLGDQVDTMPALGCGVVFAAGLNETVALEPDTGEVLWRYDGGGHEETALAYRDGTLYVADPAPVALDARTGEVEWRADGGRTIALGDDGLYAAEFANGDGDLYGYDLGGEERFHLSLGKIVGSPTVADGTVFVVDNAGTVHAVDAATGRTEWSRAFDNGKLFTGLAVRDGTLYLPAGHGVACYALDAATGEVRWKQRTRMVTGRPVVGPDWVAFGRTNIGVSVYDRETGEHRRTWTREEHDLGIVRGLVPVEDGLVVDGGSPTGLTLLA